MQENFLSKISHEVRTPINAIIGFGFLFQQTRLDDQQRKYLTTIIQSAENLLQTFQGILDFSTAEDGSLKLQSLPFHVDDLMTNIAQVINLRCQEKSLKFSYEIAQDMPAGLLGDSIRISQILLSLASNSVKYTNEGRVHIQVDKVVDGEEQKVRFSVIDTGIGVPEEFRQSIFEPFFQVDNSHTRIYGGAGLGLATGRQLATLMNGQMSIEDNTIDGKGSIFSVTLPLVEAEYGSIIYDGPLNGKKILILDHDPLRTQSIAATMTSLGLNIVTSDDPEKCLEMIGAADDAGEPFNFALMAWQMPGMDSMETAQYIQQIPTKYPSPALIMMADYSLSEIYSAALEIGFFDLIETPASLEVYQGTLEAALEEQEELTRMNAAGEEIVVEEVSTRILLVEDNEINQEIAYEVLTSAQYVVDIANNGQEAVEAVEKVKYGLILMDIQMPVLDGLSATKKIRAAGHKMPIIAMTAHGMADDKEISLAAGMNAHLTKPLEPMALFSTMTKWLPTSTIFNKIEDKKDTRSSGHGIVRKEKLPQKMEGFNLEGGLATVGGNEALYISLLRKFADRYANINKEISDCIQNDDIETAIRHAHTVRGIAANLGAEELSSAAEALEKAIALAPSMTAPHLRTLVLRLTAAVDAIHENLGSSAVNEDVEVRKDMAECLNVAEREHARHVLDKAIKNMEIDWGHANDTVQYLLERLENSKAENELKKLKHALEDFEVEQAQEHSLIIQKMLQEHA